MRNDFFLEGGGKRLTFRPTLGVVFAMCEHVRETFQSKAARLTHRMLRSFTRKKHELIHRYRSHSGMELQEERWQDVPIYHEEVLRELPRQSVRSLRGVIAWPDARWLKPRTSKSASSIENDCSKIIIEIYEDDEPPNPALTSGHKRESSVDIKKGRMIKSLYDDRRNKRPTRNATRYRRNLE